MAIFVIFTNFGRGVKEGFGVFLVGFLGESGTVETILAASWFGILESSSFIGVFCFFMLVKAEVGSGWRE